MGERPIFVPCDGSPRLVDEVVVRFTWHPGFAPVQKKRNVEELHAAASKMGLRQVLEVSTKSAEKLGVRLSAFNLKVELPDGRRVPLECAYQGSKVFEDGGPYADLYEISARDAKRDRRLRSSGKLIGFRFVDTEWKLEPKTAFYDWLYLSALREHSEYLRRLLRYDAFSDIEFDPERSVNTQARSCALLVCLLKKDLFPKAAHDRNLFLSILGGEAATQLGLRSDNEEVGTFGSEA